VQAVVHAHAEDVLPFSISTTALRPVIHSGSFMGAHVPVWDIADRFGPDTNMLVTNMEQARDLARCLGPNNVALMRGHGFSAAARSLIEVVRMAVYIPRNARVQMNALRLGREIRPLHDGEIAARDLGYKPYSLETRRACAIGPTRRAAPIWSRNSRSIMCISHGVRVIRPRRGLYESKMCGRQGGGKGCRKRR